MQNTKLVTDANITILDLNPSLCARNLSQEELSLSGGWGHYGGYGGASATAFSSAYASGGSASATSFSSASAYGGGASAIAFSSASAISFGGKWW